MEEQSKHGVSGRIISALSSLASPVMSKPVNYQIIETAADLQQFVDKLTDSDWLALDTEFIRESTYYPELALLQISNGEHTACIDPIALSLDELEPLRALIYREDITKVLHAASQDLEIFNHLYGRPPSPIFDTQMAGALLGMDEQAGYGSLVQQRLGIRLDKAHSRADWKRRPLSQKELDYAAADVIHLAALFPALIEELESRGRLGWLDEDFTQLSDPGKYTPDPDTAWKRLKGLGRLRPVQQHIGAALARWRENTAIAQNRPRGWILKDDVLLDLARMQPADKAGLSRLRGLHDKTIHRNGDDLLKIISENQVHQHALIEKSGAILDKSQKPVVELLLAQLSQLAMEMQMAPGLITRRKDIEKMVSGERDLRLLQGWRLQAAGQALLDTLEGRSMLNIKKGRISAGPQA